MARRRSCPSRPTPTFGCRPEFARPDSTWKRSKPSTTRGFGSTRSPDSRNAFNEAIATPDQFVCVEAVSTRQQAERQAADLQSGIEDALTDCAAQMARQDRAPDCSNLRTLLARPVPQAPARWDLFFEDSVIWDEGQGAQTTTWPIEGLTNAYTCGRINKRGAWNGWPENQCPQSAPPFCWYECDDPESTMVSLDNSVLSLRIWDSVPSDNYGSCTVSVGCVLDPSVLTGCSMF